MEAPCFSILYYFQMKRRKQMAQVNLEIVLVQESFVMYAKSKRLQQKQAAYFPQIPRTSPECFRPAPDVPSDAAPRHSQPHQREAKHMIHPLAITMWDFSWIERRWDGAGFEDWNAALDGVKERGYDAVRIDAFPHLLSQAPEKEWLLLVFQ